jgi:hypothetical protein
VAQELELGRPRLVGQVGHPRPVPGRQVARVSPRRGPQHIGVERLGGPGAVAAVAQRDVERDDRQAGGRSLLQHRAQPCRALVEPVAEQLGVPGGDAEPAAGHPGRGARHEVAGVRADLAAARAGS